MCRLAGPISLARVRLTEFWNRMRAQFGDVYADSVAKDYVLAALGSRTVNQAIADGAARGCSYTVTLDKKAARRPGFRLARIYA